VLCLSNSEFDVGLYFTKYLLYWMEIGRYIIIKCKKDDLKRLYKIIWGKPSCYLFTGAKISSIKIY
jgi:hypothetical protein